MVSVAASTLPVTVVTLSMASDPAHESESPESDSGGAFCAPSLFSRHGLTAIAGA